MVYLALDDLINTTGIIFSRQSLVSKVRQLNFGREDWEIDKTLRRFQKVGYVKQKEGVLRITERGRRRINRRLLTELRLNPRKSKWDGKWRLVIFDIPEMVRDKRDQLRFKLTEWEFTQLQQSVFIAPYDCVVELSSLVTLLNSTDFVHVFTISSMEEKLEQRLKGIYKLR